MLAGVVVVLYDKKESKLTFTLKLQLFSKRVDSYKMMEYFLKIKSWKANTLKLKKSTFLWIFLKNIEQNDLMTHSLFPRTEFIQE